MTYPVERVQRFPFPLPQPAAGANFVLTPTGLGIWRILSLVAVLTTSAVVANRAVVFSADDGTTTYFRTPAPSVQAASLALRYAAFDGSSPQATVGTVAVAGWPNSGLALYPGHSLRSAVDNLDVADQWTLVAVMVEELPTGREVSATPVESFQVESW